MPKKKKVLKSKTPECAYGAEINADSKNDFYFAKKWGEDLPMSP